MQKNLVIVESPAKAKTIGKFLGEDYKVMSSFGHIRDLKKKGFGVDVKTFSPEYEIPKDKQQLVSELREEAKNADVVWLASDEDREGEAIAWHLAEVLGLPEESRRRIVFHEITKPAILSALEHPRTIDGNLVDAQQARRVLDRIVGFRLSPVLWRKVKPSLSAGRVQSVAVRLVVEREREIRAFSPERNYRVVALFSLTGDGGAQTSFKAELSRRFATEEEAGAFLNSCKEASFRVETVTMRPQHRSPAPPFTTSTLQQEAARKLGFGVSQTMSLAQRLYEQGHITYMRTDSMNLSSLCIDACKAEIETQMGAAYSSPRHYHTTAKGAQEAHEAIRPTHIEKHEIKASQAEARLYQLIWKRTMACQMADAQIEKTDVRISVEGKEEQFAATGEVVKFDGFLRLYRESREEDHESRGEEGGMLPPLHEGEALSREEITATERFTQHPARYNEASLVHKLEELGIGRPSTYAPIISTIQQREYVTRGDKEGFSRPYVRLTLTPGGEMKKESLSETIGAEKNKLLPTDIGVVVNDYLTAHFPDILDYNFTARVEKDFDEVAEGKADWVKMMGDFYVAFEPTVEKAMKEENEHKTGELELGTDPKTKRKVYVKIGRYGPVVQIGDSGEKEKPRFAPLLPGQSMEDITLEEALKLFCLPRMVGTFEGKELEVNVGRFGPYVRHDGKYFSLPKDSNPLAVTHEDAMRVIILKRRAEKEKHIKSFPEDENMEILKGPYGPYIVYDGKNYHVPRPLAANAAELTHEQCLEIVKEQNENPKPKKGRRSKSAK